jgi:hypothetical protein
MIKQLNFGGVGEWLKPAVLKTVRPQKGLVGSNPTPSASQSGDFSLPGHFAEKCRFCGRNGPTFTRSNASGFFEPGEVTPIGAFFSQKVRVVPFAARAETAY